MQNLSYIHFLLRVFHRYVFAFYIIIHNMHLYCLQIGMKSVGYDSMWNRSVNLKK